MNPRDQELFRRGLVVFDVVIMAMVFLGVLYVRQFAALGGQAPDAPVWLANLSIEPTDIPRYPPMLLWLVPLWSVALWTSNTGDFRATKRTMLLRYGRAVGMSVAGFLLVVFLLKLEFVPRTFVFFFAAAAVVSLLFLRVVVMETIGFLRSKRVDGHRVLVVGCGKDALGYAQSIRQQPPWNVKLLGHLSVGDEQYNPKFIHCLGDVSILEPLLDKMPVDEVLFAAYPRLDAEELANALHACDERGVDVLLPLPPTLPQSGRVEVTQVAGFDMPMLGFRRTPTDNLALLLKRGLDILGGLVGLVFAAPVLLALAVTIKLTSKGPVLFRQERSGRHGRRFAMFKFRSMVVDAEHQKNQLQHLNEMSGPVFKIKSDPRVTPIGKFIRRTSLDELPQLFNIMMGDMSLVGPRPPLPSEVDQYKPWQRRRLSVKPGLTGLWQVSGRNQVDFEEWMALDLRYIDDWSLWLDLKIILRTVPAVLFRSGAS